MSVWCTFDEVDLLVPRVLPVKVQLFKGVVLVYVAGQSTAV